MIYPLFLGLLCIGSSLAEPEDDPCKVLDCNYPSPDCNSYKFLCQKTDGCFWSDNEECNLLSQGMSPKAAECCYSWMGMTMFETTMFSTMEESTTPSPTICENNIDQIGKGAQFRFVSDCDKDEFVKIKMMSLIEYDVYGKKTNNKITSFASADWYWITDENETYNGYDADINKYVSTMEIKRNYQKYEFDFNLTTVLFKEEAEVGNRTISQETLKWTTDIDGWPFMDDNNTLELCINIMTNGGRYGRSTYDHKGDSSDSSEDDDGEFAFNDYGFTLIDTAFCDDEEFEVEITRNKKSYNQMNICFVFAACDGVIDYDPFVRYIGSTDQPRDGSTAKIVEISVAVGVSASLLFAIAIVAGLYCRKNKKLQNDAMLLNSTQNGGYDTMDQKL